MAAIPYDVAREILTGGHAYSGAFHVANGVAMSYALEIGRYLEGAFIFDGKVEYVVVRDVKRSVTTSRHVAALKGLPKDYLVILTDEEYGEMLRLAPSQRVRYALCKKKGLPFPQDEQMKLVKLSDELQNIADVLNGAAEGFEQMDSAKILKYGLVTGNAQWQRDTAKLVEETIRVLKDAENR